MKSHLAIYRESMAALREAVMRSEVGWWAACLSRSASSSCPPGFSADMVGEREKERRPTFVWLREILFPGLVMGAVMSQGTLRRGDWSEAV